MEKCANPYQQCIRMDAFGGLFSQVGNLQAMLVGPWSTLEKVVQQG